MNLYKEWLDRYGFLHLKPNPEPEATENAPTFTAELMLLQKLNYGSVGEIPAIKKLRLASGELRTTPVSTFGGHVSHDTVTGLYCIRELSGIKNFPLPTFKWNNRFWAHPRDHIFYGAMNGNPIALLLLPLLLVISAHTFKKERGNTSGKCLWFLRFGTLMLSKNKILQKVGKSGMILAEKMLEKEHGKNPFIDVFGIYFQEPLHPIRMQIVRFYDSKGLL